MPVSDAGDNTPTEVAVVQSPQSMEKMVRYAAEVTQAGTPLVRRILAESSGDANALVHEALDLKSTLTVSWGGGLLQWRW